MAARELKLDLSGEVVVLTGGGGVLCGTMARALAGCGAAVGVLAGLFLQRGRKSALEVDRFRRGTEYAARWSPDDVRVPAAGYLRSELQVRSVWQSYLNGKRGA